MFSLFPAANIITADNGCRGKPHPDIYLTAAQSLGKSQPHLLFFFDPGDIKLE
jgi:beta-phosphoglucomutase-like phosphatase (HAD superfamily)